MTEELEISQGKSVGELGHEALWFAAYTIIAIITMVLTILMMGAFNPDPDSSGPKFLGTFLAFLIPLIVGFLIAKVQNNPIARYVWLAGLLIFAIACVWVIDLPTGPGLCEHCTSLVERLQRTFFSFDHGSGLMGGQGVMVGCWVPLSLFGFAIGAKFALDSE
jgi:hypothetical protein